MCKGHVLGGGHRYMHQASYCTDLQDCVIPSKPSAARGQRRQIHQGGPAHVPNQGACPAKVAKADASAPWNSTVGPLLAILARSLIRPSFPSTCRKRPILLQ